jgi:hypothetical protein
MWVAAIAVAGRDNLLCETLMPWLSSIDASNMSVYEAKYVLYHVPDVLSKCDMSTKDVYVLLQFVETLDLYEVVSMSDYIPTEIKRIINQSMS